MDLKMDFATLLAARETEDARAAEEKKLSEYFDTNIRVKLEEVQHNGDRVKEAVRRSRKLARSYAIATVIAYIVCVLVIPEIASLVFSILTFIVAWHFFGAFAKEYGHFSQRQRVLVEALLDQYGSFAPRSGDEVRGLLSLSGIDGGYRLGSVDVAMSGVYKGVQTTIAGVFIGASKYHKDAGHALYVCADYHAPMEGETRVYSRRRRSTIDPTSSPLQNIVLEANEFMREFEVRATSQVEARTLLHPEMMVDLLDFFYAADVRGVDCSFAAGRMHILLHLSHQPLQPVHSFDRIDLDHVRDLNVEIAKVMHMIDHLEIGKIRLT